MLIKYIYLHTLNWSSENLLSVRNKIRMADNWTIKSRPLTIAGWGWLLLVFSLLLSLIYITWLYLFYVLEWLNTSFNLNSQVSLTYRQSAPLFLNILDYLHLIDSVHLLGHVLLLWNGIFWIDVKPSFFPYFFR